MKFYDEFHFVSGINSSNKMNIYFAFEMQVLIFFSPCILSLCYYKDGTNGCLFIYRVKVTERHHIFCVFLHEICNPIFFFFCDEFWAFSLPTVKKDRKSRFSQWCSYCSLPFGVFFFLLNEVNLGNRYLNVMMHAVASGCLARERARALFTLFDSFPSASITVTGWCAYCCYGVHYIYTHTLVVATTSIFIQLNTENPSK